MILLDTHIWIWWVQDDPRLSAPHRGHLLQHEPSGLGVSAISCWETAKLVELGRLVLPCPPLEWIHLALQYPGVRLIELSPEVCVASTELPGEFHRDPADQILVATARVHDLELVTADARILTYPHVRLLV